MDFYLPPSHTCEGGDGVSRRGELNIIKINEVNKNMNTTYNYSGYIDFNHKIIPDEDFMRYSDMAEKTIKRYIKTLKTIPDENTGCIFEIADILYAEQNQLNLQIAGFSNENYRENYFEGNNLTANEKIWEVIRLYFTNRELYRGV